jgi:hypothetical protein
VNKKLLLVQLESGLEDALREMSGSTGLEVDQSVVLVAKNGNDAKFSLILLFNCCTFTTSEQVVSMWRSACSAPDAEVVAQPTWMSVSSPAARR